MSSGAGPVPAAAPAGAGRTRAVALLYFAAGHAALLAACLAFALRPESLAGFFLHPRLAAVVHLVTLGWLTTSILGALFMVWPVALGDALPGRRLDAWACGLVLLGVSGVVSHFWLDGYVGVALSGCVVLAGALMTGVRFVRALPRARGPLAVRLHVGLAWGNFFLVVLLGVALALHRDRPLLPAARLDAVFAHLHLGLIGWVAMMVVGVGYRLLPMFLPAHPPAGKGVWGTAILLECGALGVAVAFLFAKPWVPLFAASAAAGLLLFLWQVAGMLRARVPAPPTLQRPDLGTLHALQALLYLLAAVPLGLTLTLVDGWPLGWIMAYGVFVLLGFPAQMVLGISMRLFPMFAWRESWLGSGFRRLPLSPHRMPARSLQWGVLLLWTAGVPLLAWGLASDRLGAVSTAGALLAAGTLLAAVNAALVLRWAWRRRGEGIKKPGESPGVQ